MLDFSEIKLGKIIEFNGKPFVVIKCDFLKMQQGKPVKKCSLRSLINKSVINYSFKSGETVSEAEINRKSATFMYADGEALFFMLTDNYETVEINSQVLGGKEVYLKPEQKITVLFYNDDPISVDMPVKVSLEVIQTDPVAKGNTVNNVMKDAKLETNLNIKVPAFINIGDKIIVNTQDNAYVERDTSNK
jgi:elongation factor P